MSLWRTHRKSDDVCILEALERRVLLSGEASALAAEVHEGWLAESASEPPPGYTVLWDVPEYTWTHGCGPTAGAMVLAYWDILAYPNFFPGDASTQTADVKQAIASLGNGDGTLVNPGTPGTGHVPDYAFYALVNDSGWPAPFPDMSTPPAAPTGTCTDGRRRTRSGKASSATAPMSDIPQPIPTRRPSCPPGA